MVGGIVGGILGGIFGLGNDGRGGKFAGVTGSGGAFTLGRGN
jgi:hypothetical protein